MRKSCGFPAMLILLAAGCDIISTPNKNVFDSQTQKDCRYQADHRPVNVDLFHSSICTGEYWYRLWILVQFAE
jgi:hypothetical protein